MPPEAFRPTVELAKAGALAPTAPALLADLEAGGRCSGTGYENPKGRARHPAGVPRAGDRNAGAGRQFERLFGSLDARDLLRIEPDLERLEVPTLVVWGTADEFFDLRWAYWLPGHDPGRPAGRRDRGKPFFPDERAD